MRLQAQPPLTTAVNITASTVIRGEAAHELETRINGRLDLSNPDND